MDHGIDNITLSTLYDHIPTGEKTVSADLHNGFLYIAELLLQHHSFLMYRSIETLTESNIKVFPIKTDALTIKNDDLDLAQQLLDFEPGLGTWRHSKTTEEMICSNKTIREKNNKFNTSTTKSNHNSSFKYSRKI